MQQQQRLALAVDLVVVVDAVGVDVAGLLRHGLAGHGGGCSLHDEKRQYEGQQELNKGTDRRVGSV